MSWLPEGVKLQMYGSWSANHFSGVCACVKWMMPRLANSSDAAGFVSWTAAKQWSASCGLVGAGARLRVALLRVVVRRIEEVQLPAVELVARS